MVVVDYISGGDFIVTLTEPEFKVLKNSSKRSSMDIGKKLERILRAIFETLESDKKNGLGFYED